MFAIDSRNIPTIRSFAACVALAERRRKNLTARRERSHEEWSVNKLPLSDNRGRWSNQGHKRMEWNDTLKAWNIILYRTTVVRYYADGRVMLNASYDSQSTRNFFSEVCPEGVWLMSTRYGRAYCVGHATHKWDQTTYGEDVEWHEVNRDIHPQFTELSQGLLIDAQGVVLNPMPWTTKRVVSDKERRKEIRAKLKPFMTWFDAMTTVGSSIRGVVAGAEKTEEPGRSGHYVMCAVEAPHAIEQMLDSLVHAENYNQMYEEPDHEHMVWRRACWAARLACADRFDLWGWGNRSDDEKYHLAYAPRMKAHIVERAFRLHDGYKEIAVVAPAGEKP